MGNFTDTGKEIYYDDESLLSIFKNLSEPISRNELIKTVKNDTNVDNIEIENAIDYLISESFIINNDDYIKTLKNEDYNRQNLFFNMFTNTFIDYEKKFKNKKVLILGLGGIGSNTALLLSRAGFDNFVFVDCDNVEESNLIRQLSYNENDVGNLKTESLYKKIKNNKNNIIIYNKKILCKDDISNEIKYCDFVLCTLDKPKRKIRRIINELCIEYEKPVLFCGFSEHVGMIGPFIIPNITPCLLCTEKDMNEEPINNVDITPSYGPLCAIISSIASNEIIKYYSNYSLDNLLGKTLMFNCSTYETKIIKWKKNKKCKECGNNEYK